MKTKNGRKIVTRSSTGLNKPFQWASIGSAHQTAIGDEDTLDAALPEPLA